MTHLFASARLRAFCLVAVLLLALPATLLAQNKKPPTLPPGTEKLQADLLKSAKLAAQDPSFRAMMERAGIDPNNMSMEALMTANWDSANKAGIPEADAAVLQSLPKKTLTEPQLKAELTQLYNQLLGAMPPAQKTEVLEVIQQYGADTNLARLAVLAWYQGAQPQGTLLALKAAEKNTQDHLNLTNLGAFLTMGGVAAKAIPVLQYVVQRYPSHPQVLNNLGQAWAALGQPDSATVYFARCLKREPLHPEANRTMAIIEEKKGQPEKGLEYARKSLEGGYNEGAAKFIMDVSNDTESPAKQLRKGGLPNYFNEFKFKLPAQQTFLAEYYEVLAERKAFLAAIEQEIQRLGTVQQSYQKKGWELHEKNTAILAANPGAFGRNHNGYIRPFTGISTAILPELMRGKTDNDQWMRKLHEQTMTELGRLDEFRKKTIDEINTRIDAELDKLPCGEGSGSECDRIKELFAERCTLIDAANTQYLKACAPLVADMQDKWQNLALQDFYHIGKWQYLGGSNIYLAKAGYYMEALQYLYALRDLSGMGVMEAPYCQNLSPASKNASASIGDFQCPVEIEIPFIVGSIKLNCEEAAIEASFGAKFKFAQNFKTKQSTLSLGIGLGFEKGIEVGGIEGKAEIGIGQELFITFSDESGFVDAGMKFGVKASAGVTLSGTENLSGLDGKISRELGKTETGIGYQFGVNSGFEFDEGPLKALLAPTAPKQINPKVQMYKK